MADENKGTVNWGSGAKRYNTSVFGNQTSPSSGSDHISQGVNAKDLLSSRLWHGVPQLTADQLASFNAAFTGHTFLFVVKVPTFLTTGIYGIGTNAHYQMRNLKAVIERASMGLSGGSNITAQFTDQNDGAGRKVSHATQVTKEQNDVSIRLHEFEGLPVKNALELWLTGIYDPRSQHGSYHGNLQVKWGLENHTMAVLAVQVDPSWTRIQDAVYYFNMIPNEVPFEHFNWTKGESDIIQDYDISFKCNEDRGPAIMYAAEQYMNNRILSLAGTSVYNYRQFVPYDFGMSGEGGTGEGDLAYDGAIKNTGTNTANHDTPIIDRISSSETKFNGNPIMSAQPSGKTITPATT